MQGKNVIGYYRKMKYLLVIHLCSLLTGTCPEYKITGLMFNSHYECALAGYKIAGATLESMASDEEYFGVDEINRRKLALKFECDEIKRDPIVPPPKPKVKV